MVKVNSVKVNTNVENYGDFIINEIKEVFNVGDWVSMIYHYDLFSLECGYLGSYRTKDEAVKSMENCRVLSIVCNEVDKL